MTSRHPEPGEYTTYEAFAQAHTNPIAENELRARWAQHHILVAIAEVRTLRQLLVFKGGNALRSAYGSVRATKDLDFSIELKLPQDDVKRALEQALRRASRRTDMELRIQSFKPRPKNEDSTRRTWVISIGYAFKSNAGALERLRKEPPKSVLTIPVEISENEAVGIYETNHITGANNLQVSTVENIIAEKLRALLQQPQRNRYRAQDVFDIAYQCRRAKRNDIPAFDLTLLREQFIAKCVIRDVSPDLNGFQNDEVWKRAERDYSQLEATVLMKGQFILFENARAEVEELIHALQHDDITHYPSSA